MDFDPSDMERLINLPAMASKLTLPGMDGNDAAMTCYTDDDGVNKCFNLQGKNGVFCKGDDCFVSYKTMNQKVLGNGRRLKKLDLDVLLIPDGLASPVILVGNIPRKNLRTLKRVLGDVEVTEADELPELMHGFPRPPKKCHLNPLSPDCTPYLSSDDWMYIPAIGFKRKVDVMKNPRTILKSEVFDQIKKVGSDLAKIFKRKKNVGKKIIGKEKAPMQERDSRVDEFGISEPKKRV